MLASKLVCPHCHAVIRADRPVPVGKHVRCPRCATRFIAPAPVATAFTAQPVAVSGPLANHYLSPPPDAVTPPPARSRYLATVLVGLAVLLLAGGAIAAVMFWSRSGTPETETEQMANSQGRSQFQVQPLIVLTPQEEQKVKDLTNRGIEFLKNAQRPDGSWSGTGARQHIIGVTALAGLTLMECGVPKDDPHVQKAAYYLRDAMPRLNLTYEISLAIFFFNRLDKKEDEERIQKLALRLVVGQQPQGGWSYVCRILSSEADAKLLPVLTTLAEGGPDLLGTGRAGLLASLPPNLSNLACFQDTRTQSPAFFRSGINDNSNTQFALLALWTAHRHHLPVEPSLSLAARHFEHTQNPDGGWFYQGNRYVSRLPTMTCAGLIGLAVGYGLAKDTHGRWGGRHSHRPAEDPAVLKGIERVARDVGKGQPDPNAPPPPMTEMYFLWSVERVGVLWQLKTIGGKHWYQWGLHMLTAGQRPDGSWQANQGIASLPNIDTCFALLFLQRVNLAEDLTNKLQEMADLELPRAAETKK